MRILKLLSALSIAGVLALCFFSWYSSDDICYRNELARYSVFEKAWLQYMHWDGRSLGIASLVQLTCLKYFSARVVTFVWAICFIGIAIMILSIIQLENSISQLRKISLINVGLLTSVLWLGMWKLIPDIIYWSTGGWYCMMCLLGLLWIYIFLSGLKAERFSSARCVFIFIISFVCGNNSHNFVIALVLLAVIESSNAWIIKKDKRAVVYILCALAGLALSSCIVLFAPGNQERLKAISWNGFNASFLYFCFVVLARYCYWLLGLVVLCIFVLWINGKDLFSVKPSFSSLRNKFSEAIKTKQSFVATIYSHKYLLASISTVTVFSATSFFAVPRTGIFFGTFLVIYLLGRSIVDVKKINSKRFIYGSSVIFISFLGVIIFEMIKVNSLEKQIAMREQHFEMNKGKDVVVATIPDSNIPFAFTFVDLSADTTYWVNRCVALNYELKTVRTVSK